MSFILDALKKSESDRQRQSGPALFEVKVAPPKSRFPVWAIAIVALLVVNMIIVGWMLVRRASHGEDTAANTPPAAGATAAPAAGNNNTPAPVAPPIAMGRPGPASGTPDGPPPGSMSPTSAPATTAQQQSWPTSNQQGMGTAQNRIPGREQNEPTLAGGATAPGNARETGGANTGPAADPSANPDDYAPAAEPGSPLFKGHVQRGTESGLVLYQDAALVPGANLPQLRLDLHVYAVKPPERFALINMHRVHEGDSLQDGVRVEAITPDGVVMSHNGSRFLLPRE